MSRGPTVCQTNRSQGWPPAKKKSEKNLLKRRNFVRMSTSFLDANALRFRYGNMIRSVSAKDDERVTTDKTQPTFIHPSSLPGRLLVLAPPSHEHAPQIPTQREPLISCAGQAIPLHPPPTPAPQPIRTSKPAEPDATAPLECSSWGSPNT